MKKLKDDSMIDDDDDHDNNDGLHDVRSNDNDKNDLQAVSMVGRDVGYAGNGSELGHYAGVSLLISSLCWGQIVIAIIIIIIVIMLGSDCCHQSSSSLL